MTKQLDDDNGAVSKADKKNAGTENLLIGSGFGALGVLIAGTTGVVCPVCVVASTSLLGMGAYEKYKSTQNKKEGAVIKENGKDSYASN